MAKAVANRLYNSSCFSVILGINVFLSKSWEIAEEIVISKPAAVDKAAATPPAATRAITQKGSLAISGFANTIISASM